MRISKAEITITIVQLIKQCALIQADGSNRDIHLMAHVSHMNHIITHCRNKISPVSGARILPGNISIHLIKIHPPGSANT